ncbi:MAG: TraM recognition domain-containing protein [Coprococcus comes]
MMMITQSMADIDLIYGKPEREAMMNNFAYKVVLGVSDTETQEYFQN